MFLIVCTIIFFLFNSLWLNRYQVELENLKDEYVRTLEETRKEKVFLLVFTYLLELPLENGWEW